MELREVESNKLIANRVPPSDNWRLLEDPQGIIYTSLTDTLEAYFELTGFRGEYRLAPLESKLYAIISYEEEVKPPPLKTYNIYEEEEG